MPPWPFKRALWIARKSLTVFWGYLLIVAGAIMDLMPTIAYFFNAPEMQAIITSYTGPYASHVLKAIGLITVLVRLRTLGKGGVS